MNNIKISHSLAFLDDFVGYTIEIYKKKNPTMMYEAITCLEDIRKILRAIDRAGKEIDKNVS